jgi:hypothetical protein
MAIDITSESTHEDITTAVDQIIESRKGDGALIAEERDKPTGDMTAEEDSGSTVSDGEEAEAGPEWLDDDLKEELSAYGIDEKELAEFSSREEVDRAMRLLDKSALEAGRKALVSEDKPEPAVESTEGKYEISLDKDIYDDGLVDELSRMRDHYETRLSKLEARLMEADVAAEEQQFDALVDTLGHSDLFGTTGKENSKQLQRRQDLLVAARAQRIGLQAMGRSVDLDQALVNRVSKMVFAEEIAKKDLKAKTRKISQQSNSRLGGGATRPSEPGESLREEMRRLYKEKEAG